MRLGEKALREGSGVGEVLLRVAGEPGNAAVHRQHGNLVPGTRVGIQRHPGLRVGVQPAGHERAADEHNPRVPGERGVLDDAAPQRAPGRGSAVGPGLELVAHGAGRVDDAAHVLVLEGHGDPELPGVAPVAAQHATMLQEDLLAPRLCASPPEAQDDLRLARLGVDEAGVREEGVGQEAGRAGGLLDERAGAPVGQQAGDVVRVGGLGELALGEGGAGVGQREAAGTVPGGRAEQPLRPHALGGALELRCHREGEDEVAEGVAWSGAAQGSDDLDAVLHGEQRRLVHLADNALHVPGSPGTAQQGDAIEEADEPLRRGLRTRGARGA